MCKGTVGWAHGFHRDDARYLRTGVAQRATIIIDYWVRFRTAYLGNKAPPASADSCRSRSNQGLPWSNLAVRDLRRAALRSPGSGGRPPKLPFRYRDRSGVE